MTTYEDLQAYSEAAQNCVSGHECDKVKLLEAAAKEAGVDPEIIAAVSKCATSGDSDTCARAAAGIAAMAGCVYLAGPSAAPLCAEVCPWIVDRLWPILGPIAGATVGPILGPILQGAQAALQALNIIDDPPPVSQAVMQPIADAAWPKFRQAQDSFADELGAIVTDIMTGIDVDPRYIVDDRGRSRNPGNWARSLFEEQKARSIAYSGQAWRDGQYCNVVLPDGRDPDTASTAHPTIRSGWHPTDWTKCQCSWSKFYELEDAYKEAGHQYVACLEQRAVGLQVAMESTIQELLPQMMSDPRIKNASSENRLIAIRLRGMNVSMKPTSPASSSGSSSSGVLIVGAGLLAGAAVLAWRYGRGSRGKSASTG